MQERRLVVPAILFCSLLAQQRAAADPPRANAVVVVPVPFAVPTPGTPTPPTPAAPALVAPAPAAAPLVAPAPPAATPPAAQPTAKLVAPKTPIQAALQQVVMLERGGRPIAIGTLLNGDGRILTALSPLTHGNQLIAHYPEGQLVPVKLSYSDRAWDLALLTPEGDTRRAGLKASRDPAPTAGSKLRAVTYVKDKQLGSAELAIKAKATLRGADSAELPEAFELPFAAKAADVGAPLINEKGEVVAIIARACAATNKLGCTLAPYGAPVSAIRDFLRSVPMRRTPSLGLEVVAFDAGVARGVRVATLAPDGPAASSGLRAGGPGVGDVVLAVDGKPVATPQAFTDALENHATGAPARLTVLSEGRYREVLLAVQGATDSPAFGSAASAPARNDRVYRSNPSGAAPPPLPTSVPNPYR